MRGSMAKKRRRESALERLRESEFFEKLDKKGSPTRTKESWQNNKDREIDILEKRIR